MLTRIPGNACEGRLGRVVSALSLSVPRPPMPSGQRPIYPAFLGTHFMCHILIFVKKKRKKKRRDKYTAEEGTLIYMY